MKRLLIILILLLLPVSGWGSVGIDHVRTLGDMFLGANNGYAYGVDSGHDNVIRMDSSYSRAVQSAIATVKVTTAEATENAEVDRVYVSNTNDLIFAVVYAETTGTFFILRSTDAGANWSDPVLRLGQQKACTVSGNHSAEDTTIEVSDDEWFASGDLIGIAQDNSTILWTTVNGAPDANTITITDGLTYASAGGSQVYKHVPGVRYLGSMTYLHAASGYHYIVEYNVASGRVAGGKHDALNFWQSTDGGATWSSIAEWNTDGSNRNIFHFHGIFQDPTTEYIYLNAETGLIQWDESAAIPDNTDPDDYSSTGIAGLGGANRYICGGTIFKGSYGYMIADTSEGSHGATETGIWRFPATQWGNFGGDKTTWKTNNYVRVSSTVNDYDDQAAMMDGINAGGDLVAFSYVGEGVTDFRLPILTSEDGSTWDVAGLIGFDNNASNAFAEAVFEFGGNIWVALTDLSAGYSLLAPQTVVFSVTGEADSAKLVFPVQYVDGVNGTDSADGIQGMSAGTGAWATLEYALENAYVSKGSTVKVVGSSTNAQIGVALSTGEGGATTGETLIEGSDRATAIVTRGSSVTLLSGVSSAESPVRFKDLTLTNTEGGAVYYGGDASAVLTFENCTIGDAASGSSTYTIRADGAGTVYTFNRCHLVGLSSGGGSIIDSRADVDVIATSCIFTNGYRHFYINADADFEAYNCVFYLSATASYACVHSGSSNASIPILKNCIFYDSSSGNAAIRDDASLTETDGEIDYNFYYNLALTNVANSGGSHIYTNVDPKWFNLGTDFRIQAGSPCINVGTVPFSDGDGDQYDYAGNLVWRDSDDKAVGAWSDGVEIGAYGWFGGILLQ